MYPSIWFLFQVCVGKFHNYQSKEKKVRVFCADEKGWTSRSWKRIRKIYCEATREERMSSSKISSSKISSIKTSRESDTLLATGFRVDVVSEIVDGYFDQPNVPKGVQLRQRARNFIEWESRRLALAQKTLSLSAETVPLAHIFTLTGSTRGLWLEKHNAQDGDLFKTYLHLLNNVTKAALDEYADVETLTKSHDYMWIRIHGINLGRRYFSTENGRLGLGPPEIQKGDTVCVFYGTGTVMLLRPAKSNPGEWYFVGDAFVHGLMKLDETPESARGADEIFTIA